MRKLFFFAILGLISFNAYSQEVAPKEVLKSFQSKFSEAKNVKWEMEKQNEWEAEFILDGKEMTASFDNAGKMLESEKSLLEEDLPADIHKKLFLRFEGFEIEKVEGIETVDFKGYEIVLSKGGTEVEVLITNSGEITIKDVKVEDDEEEDDKD